MNVTLRIYDLSHGNGKIISELLGCDIEAISHTSVIISNYEIYFGGSNNSSLCSGNNNCISSFNCSTFQQLCNDNDGIFCYKDDYLSNTYNFNPIRVINMGDTNMTEHEIIAYLSYLQNRLSHDKCFKRNNYHIMKHNCNIFSNTVCMELVNKQIPSEILLLPNIILNTKIGRLIDKFAPSLFTDIDFQHLTTTIAKLSQLKDRFGKYI